MPQSCSVVAGSAAVFVLCLVVFGATLVPTVPGGDAGELLVVADALAVAHPPGYPLWTLLAHAFTLLPFGTVASRVAWLSAACTSAAAALVFACTSAVVRSRCDEGTGAVAAASGLVAAVFFAFSPLVWTYAVTAEVFALNSLLAVLVLALALRWQGSRARRDAAWIAFVVGLGLANHHTLAVLAGPVLAWLLWTGRETLLTRRGLAVLAAAGAAGLLPYVHLWTAADNPLSWGDTGTLQGLVDHVLRRDYGTFQLLPEGHAASSPWPAKTATYGRHFAEATLVVGPVLVLFAVADALANRRWRWVLLPLVAGVFYVAVFHALANVDVGDDLLLGVLARFWMQADAALAIVAGAGFGAACLRLPAIARRATWVVAVGVVVMRIGLSGGERADRGGGVVEAYGRAILEPLPARALLLTRGDLITNATRYLQESAGMREDVVVLDQELMTKPWYVRRMARRHPSLRFPGALYDPAADGGFTMAEFLEANAEGRSVYVYPDFKPGDPSTDGSWRLWPEGLASRSLPPASSPDTAAWALESASALATLEARGWPPIARYERGTWERVALEDVWQARHRRAVFLLTEAIARGNDAALLVIARGELEAASRTHPDPPYQLWLNLGIANERLALEQPYRRREQLAAWRRYLDAAPEDDPARATVAAAVARLEAPVTGTSR